MNLLAINANTGQDSLTRELFNDLSEKINSQNINKPDLFKIIEAHYDSSL
ncbi:hypothetical protein ACFL46_04015 [Candidatus Neomarinimicrobiota bacterium]